VSYPAPAASHPAVRPTEGATRLHLVIAGALIVAYLIGATLLNLSLQG
jgi:hypothetical protein